MRSGTSRGQGGGYGTVAASLFDLQATIKKRKGEYYFYIRFRAEDSRYLPAVASHQTSRAAAANWADAELAKGKIITLGKRGVTFSTLAEGFWNYDAEYITRKLARGGHFSRSFAVLRASQLKRLILPIFKNRNRAGDNQPLP